VTASEGANLRSAPDTGASILTVVPANATVAVIKADVIGTDGVSHWVQGTYNDMAGYIRTDLVSTPHAA
jgi:uncharacterized protein YgiM (DUF1202 family)